MASEGGAADIERFAPAVGDDSTSGEGFPLWLVAIAIIVIWLLVSVFVDAEYREAFNFIQAGLGLTLGSTLAAFAIALVIGLFAGLGRISRNLIVRNLATFYIEFIRGIPMLVLIFFVALVAIPAVTESLAAVGQFFVDRGLGIFTPLAELGNAAIPQLVRGIIALAVTYGAFTAEIFRAGVQSVPEGQMEAARSLGMSHAQSMRFVILPQAIRNVLPALGNDFIAMLKDSSLLSLLAVREITQRTRVYTGSTFRYPEGFMTLAILYLVMTILLSLGVRYIERRVSTDD